ncbi:MAG: high frequency lysogenization protein HflD [Gammaproteobacteria bacterium]|nr:high frequency lysogenization protein HflD [Gammaproteobacteria bacterium]
MKYSKQDRTLALAGIFQVASMVQQIARTGSASSAAMEISLETLFKFDSNNVLDIYGSPADISIGLRSLKKQLSGSNTKEDMEITRYVIGMIHLERKLSKNKTMLNKIADSLKTTQDKMDFFSLTHENIIASLAGLYQETISTLTPRILVDGEQGYLNQTSNANKIRALLLSGIRSAVLWRQCGGNRLQFLFSRKGYLEVASSILKTL